MEPWEVKEIRYIKLGGGGNLARKCFEEKRIYLGFGTERKEIFDIISKAPRDRDLTRNELSADHFGEGGAATRARNAVLTFVNDRPDAPVLWVAFHDHALWYAFTDGGTISRNDDGDGIYRNTDANGWRNVDQKKNLLSLATLSTALTSKGAFRGTICRFGNAEDYLRRKLEGRQNEALVKLNCARGKLVDALIAPIKQLHQSDFELLIDLIFARSGLARSSPVGRTQKTIDFALENPVTEEREFVQVKTRTNETEFGAYCSELANNEGDYTRMYYVYHTCEQTLVPNNGQNVIVWDAQKVAEMTVRVGLAEWVSDRAI